MQNMVQNGWCLLSRSHTRFLFFLYIGLAIGNAPVVLNLVEVSKHARRPDDVPKEVVLYLVFDIFAVAILGNFDGHSVE